MDPAEQLARLYAAGFDIQTFERFPSAVAVVRGNIVALMQPTPGGLQMVGEPGWRMGEVLGVLTEVGGCKVFQFKSELVEATPERLEELESFRRDLERTLTVVV